MAYLTIEFTGRITASDEEIRVAVARAEEVFAAAGKVSEEAYLENIRSIDESGESAALWAKADYEATKDMGEGALLAWH